MDMKLDRNRVRVMRMSEDNDDGFVAASPAERIAMVWEITKDTWTFGLNQKNIMREKYIGRCYSLVLPSINYV
jgi:hypothetical protein